MRAEFTLEIRTDFKRNQRWVQASKSINYIQNFMRHPLLDRLRRETASLHQTLETGLNLLRPEMTLDEYQAILEGFYGFYRPWEEKVQARIDELLPRFTQERRKVPMLERDLQFLRTDLSRIPACPALPDTSSVPGVLGSLYVLEGST